MHHAERAKVRRAISALIWLTGAGVIGTACAMAVRYLLRTSVRPWIGASDLPRTDLLVAAAILALGGVTIGAIYAIATQKPRWVFAFGFALLIGTRLAALTALDGRLFSDYAAYRSIANGMLAGQGFWTSVPPGYPFLEAGAIAVAGRTILAGELLNLVFSTIAGAAVYLLTRRGWGDRAGAVALATFALMPSQILFTLVLGTEIAYGACLAVVALAARHATTGRLAIVAVCGLLLGLSQYVRPTSAVLVPAFVLVFWLVASTRRSWLRAAIVLSLSFGVTVLPIVAWNATTNDRLSVSPSLFDKWTIYMGLNTQTSGRYSTAERAKVSAAAGIPAIPDDSGVPGAIFSARRLAQARAFNDAAGDLLPQRIRENGLRSLSIQPAKFALMWQNADYPVNLVFGELAPQPDSRAAATAALISQAAWILVLLAALLGLWRARRDRSPEVTLVLLIVLSAVAVHALAEVQPRYHEYFVPLLCVLAGAAAGRPRARESLRVAGLQPIDPHAAPDPTRAGR
jgi:4-amino-4-deoxy-L-arabinose transferase-like glycosyltransferase